MWVGSWEGGGDLPPEHDFGCSAVLGEAFGPARCGPRRGPDAGSSRCRWRWGSAFGSVGEGGRMWGSGVGLATPAESTVDIRWGGRRSLGLTASAAYWERHGSAVRMVGPISCGACRGAGSTRSVVVRADGREPARSGGTGHLSAAWRVLGDVEVGSDAGLLACAVWGLAWVGPAGWGWWSAWGGGAGGVLAPGPSRLKPSASTPPAPPRAAPLSGRPAVSGVLRFARSGDGLGFGPMVRAW
jgi:hypothetical protein